MNKYAKEFLRQADIIVDRTRWWSLRCRYARPDQIDVEKEAFEAEITEFFRQLKQYFCDHREDIVNANIEYQDDRSAGLGKAIEAMEAVIQDDLEREFGLVCTDSVDA